MELISSPLTDLRAALIVYSCWDKMPFHPCMFPLAHPQLGHNGSLLLLLRPEAKLRGQGGRLGFHCAGLCVNVDPIIKGLPTRSDEKLDHI